MNTTDNDRTENRPIVRRNGIVELNGKAIGDVTPVPNRTGKVGSVMGYTAYVRGVRYVDKGIWPTRREAVNEIVTVWTAAASRPSHPGQAVRSNIDGTLGVTVSHAATSGRIKVMFVGSVAECWFTVSDLTLTTLTETN